MPGELAGACPAGTARGLGRPAQRPRTSWLAPFGVEWLDLTASTGSIWLPSALLGALAGSIWVPCALLGGMPGSIWLHCALLGPLAGSILVPCALLRTLAGSIW